MKYRKKPVVIEARQWDGDIENRLSMVQWLGSAYGGFLVTPPWGLRIMTLEGEMIARPGDYIIEGVKGEKYPCKPDIFELTYEPVTE